MIVRDFFLQIRMKANYDAVDITEQLTERVLESGVVNGTVTLFLVGSTGGITTLEFESGVVQDLADLFGRLAPQNADYHHEKRWHDGNGFSHVRASLLKPSLTVPLVKGRMTLGTWQQIVVINFDNRPRNRQIAVQVMGLS